MDGLAAEKDDVRVRVTFSKTSRQHMACTLNHLVRRKKMKGKKIFSLNCSEKTNLQAFQKQVNINAAAKKQAHLFACFLFGGGFFLGGVS